MRLPRVYWRTSFSDFIAADGESIFEVKFALEQIAHWIPCLMGNHNWLKLYHEYTDYGGNSDSFKCAHCIYCGRVADDKRHSRMGIDETEHTWEYPR